MQYSSIKMMVESGLREAALNSVADLKEAKAFEIVNRVRRGKIQRRKKVASREHFTFRGGKLTRMSAKERRNRRITQRRAARKRKAKSAVALRKRRISVRKTKRLGNLRGSTS